ncbi:MAG TPA: hypothetical protein VFA59_02510 [Vicinamibacterales bacterium]|nr:hypothetical protein [Vicinamibacterales bacterium]
MAAVCAVSAQSKHGNSHQHGSQTILVSLDQPGGTGPCQVTNHPQDFGGRKAMLVTWQITNNCGASMHVQVLDFHPYNDDGSLQATESNVMNNSAGNPNTVPSTSTPIGTKGFGALVGQIGRAHGGAREDPDLEYKYTICVGPNPNPSPADVAARCLDPDGDVWP